MLLSGDCRQSSPRAEDCLRPALDSLCHGHDKLGFWLWQRLLHINCNRRDPRPSFEDTGDVAGSKIDAGLVSIELRSMTAVFAGPVTRCIRRDPYWLWFWSGSGELKFESTI